MTETAKATIEQMTPSLGEEEQRAVSEYLASGGWLTEFQKTAEFERQIAAFTGAAHAVMVNSGTSALFSALVACGIGPGDEVLVPDFTMIATANAVLLAGAVPVFVDVTRDALCLDLDLAERSITSRTRALMHVSLNGRAKDMQRVLAFCKSHRLLLIEDAAQSFGSRHRERHLGTFGLAGILSFSPLKIITTGQGGAVLTNDSEVATRVRKFKDFGRLNGGVDVHDSIGYNFKFTDLQAVIGLEQMKKLEWRVRRKKEIFALYRSELQGVSGIEFIETDLSDTTPWFIDIRTDRRDALIDHLKQAGIGTRPFYPAIHNQQPYRQSGEFPVADDAASRGLWLPSSSSLRDEDIRRVSASIREFANA